MRPLLLSLLFLGTAWAQESDDGGGFSLTDINLDDIDLSDEPDTVSFTGDFSQKSDEIAPNAAVSITHPGGNITVRCTDTDVITARIAYDVQGTTEDATGGFGRGIRMATWGKDSRGSVKVAMPYKPAAVKSYTADLTVAVPAGATVTASASRGWVQATHCQGFVKASSAKGGAYLGGQLTGFEVSASEGDVKVVLEDGGQLTRSSSVSATQGKVDLVIPPGQDLDVDARAESVSVDQPVDGTVTATAIDGALGAGGTALRVRGRTEVVIRSR